jgi:hypothetical protein
MLPFDELDKDPTLSRQHTADEFHGVPRQERPGFDTHEENDPFKIWKERGDGYLVAVEAPSPEALDPAS